jgi:hypothetical protein
VGRNRTLAMPDSTHSPLVFLCGHRKSGTTLLANLLDGHPQLAIYPNDLALLYAYFPDFIRAHDDPGERRARLQRILFTDLEERFAGLPTTPPLDVEALGEAFFGGLSDADLGNPAVLISRLMVSFQALSGLSPQVARWSVFKETSIEIYAAEILQWFPEAKFIQIMRDPRDNFSALAAGVEAHYSQLGEDRRQTLASLLHRASLGATMAMQNRKAFGPERYHLLRFEDLTGDCEGALRAVAEFLEIEFDSRLLTPTVLGLPTCGNNYDGETKISVDARNAGRWRERITPEEAQIIEFYMREVMTEFGYTPAFTFSEQAAAAAEFYKWQNYAYFYSDRFSDGGTP